MEGHGAGGSIAAKAMDCAHDDEGLSTAVSTGGCMCQRIGLRPSAPGGGEGWHYKARRCHRGGRSVKRPPPKRQGFVVTVGAHRPCRCDSRDARRQTPTQGMPDNKTLCVQNLRWSTGRGRLRTSPTRAPRGTTSQRTHILPPAPPLEANAKRPQTMCNGSPKRAFSGACSTTVLSNIAGHCVGGGGDQGDPLKPSIHSPWAEAMFVCPFGMCCAVLQKGVMDRPFSKGLAVLTTPVPGTTRTGTTVEPSPCRGRGH